MKTKSFRKVLLGLSAAALSCMMVLSGVVPIFSNGKEEAQAEPVSTDGIKDVTKLTDLKLTDYLNPSVTQKLPESVSDDREISVMVALDIPTVLDGYNELGATSMKVADFANSKEGKSIRNKITTESRQIQAQLTRKGVEYELGTSYDTLMSGFEIIIKAGDFDAVQNAVGKSAGVFISEEYERCVTYDVVENNVNVHETGIFNSEGSQYDGSGTVIAVLDTGLDYTHDAFDVSRFNGDEVITQSSLREKVNLLTASTRTPGLTASDVYINKKVPYAYDYADSDPDVYPINEAHGTHVAGIIVGQSDPKYDDDGIDDNYIRGVAPNAQLAFFKVFSESIATAKQSWIIAALEDCITLEVDVINMSLGSSCGFAREVDDRERADVYDAVKAHGISLVCAGSNDGSAAQGSEKNGSLPLSSNPDSATVGAPSTYDSALSVASISGVKTPYLLLGDEILYFTNARDFAGEERKFVDEILSDGSEEKVFDYVIVPGVGEESSYSGLDVTGKIALVERGVTNFEDKAQIAKDHGAAGCIIYNNVSGDIAMTIGATEFPTCSIDRDSGRKFINAASTIGKVKISKNQVAGPFMSDFSSWGPRPDLGIKPEITAHGGDILSCIHGQRYDRYSGTSMASPNQAGFTALVRQYVKEHFAELSPLEVTAMVNQLMMSTTDIAMNPAGIPFSVRKQGSGLANLDKATSTPAYLRTYDRYTGELSDKAKLELGDDPQKTGEKEFKFELRNISNSSLSYDLGAIIQTEGISEEFTYRGDTTITEKGYILEGARITLQGVENGTASGNTITVGANATAVVTAKITVSDTDKEYMDSQFKNGIYVEGFVTLTSKDGKCNLNVPFLSFYGSWTQAPLLDLDYFETYADEENDLLSSEDKKLPDFASTRPVGGLYGDYIAYLGTFPYQMDPNSTLNIGAEREKIALTNQEGEYGGINELNSISFGLLRGAKRMDVTITDSSTGEVVWTKTKYNLMKSYYSNGAHIYFPMDLDFKVREHNLKNNTRYDVKAVGYLDYGDGGSDNERNVFEFPFYTDFESPVATGVKYTYEYDYDTKTNRLYAEVSIYDNQYLMGYIAGAIGKNDNFNRNDPNSYMYTTNTFTSYVNPVLGERNSTNVLRIELTDQLDRIKESHDGRSFIVQCMDYALNNATYEFSIPDEVTAISFPEMKEDENGNVPGVTISPNESYRLVPDTVPSQDVVWRETIQYTSSDERIVKVENGQLLGIAPGEATITATSAYAANGGTHATATLKVKVLGPEDPGYKQYDKPTAEEFYLDGYWAEKIFYSMDPADRGLGIMKTYNDNGERNYLTLGRATSYSVEMFPSESVQLNPVVNGFFGEDNYQIRYSSSNPLIVDVTEDGIMTARNVRDNGDGTYTPQNTVRNAIVTINLDAKDQNGEWKSTFYSVSISIRVKKPYINSGAWLVNYRGLGGTVDIPASLKLTTINSYAFSGFEFIDKDLSAGDVIDEEDPYSMKQWFLGENSIKKVIIPEGVETIEAYAFAGLTGLTEVVLPSTLYKIQIGAFYGCTSLEKVSFSSENHLQFINEKGFYNCTHLNEFDFSAMIGIGKSTFENTGLMNINLPVVGSISERSFANCKQLTNVTIGSSSVKLGSEAFADCSRLTSININAKVIPSGAFDGCTELKDVTLGRDVEVIGQYAFRYTKVNAFVVDAANTEFKAMDSGKYLLDSENRIALVAPMVGSFSLSDPSITTVGKGAFSTAGDRLVTISLPNVTTVEDYAFANCFALSSLTIGTLSSVGEGAFRGTTKLTKLPTFAEGATIGNYAFAESGIAEANLPNVKSIGNYAFAYAPSLTKVNIGNNIAVGDCAFLGAYRLSEVTIGDGCTVGTRAFSGLHITEFYKDALHIEVTDERLNYYNTTAEFNYNGTKMPIAMMPYVSAISKLTIGSNVTLGEKAFYHAGSMAFRAINNPNNMNSYIDVGGVLKEVTFGEGTTIGDFAFFGCANLEKINGMAGVKSVGDYAFAGQVQGYLVFINGILEVAKINMAPKFDTLELNSVEFVGKGAFAGNVDLKSVNLNGALEKLGVSNKVIDPDEKVYVEDPLEDKVDLGAFEGCTALESIEIGNLLEIGESAFAETNLSIVKLRDGAVIGDGAFRNTKPLVNAENLGRAVRIGSEAFYGTSLGGADVFSAQYIGDFAFAYSNVTNVSFGFSLDYVGENPFAGCEVPDYTREGSNNFVSGNGCVRVIDSALYRTNGKGYELVSYPMGKVVKNVTVADKTYRIGKEAFLGAKIEVINLAREVASIGHRAFYGCENLMLVNFRSIAAPRLEEEFDYSYETDFTDDGSYKYMEEAFARVLLTFTDGRVEESGLGFVNAKMWSPSATCVFYGANFIAKMTDEALNEHTLIMVRPSNGTGYDNYTYSVYFDEVVIGRGAITDVAQTVIDMVNALPNELSDRDYDTVYSIYNLYNTLGIEDQNYLTSEGFSQRISNAKRIVDSFRTPTTPGGDDTPTETPANNTALYVVLGLVGAGLVVAIVVYFVKRKSSGDSDGTDDSNGSTEGKAE